MEKEPLRVRSSSVPVRIQHFTLASVVSSFAPAAEARLGKDSVFPRFHVALLCVARFLVFIGSG
jgi:hypothetical protein